MMTQTEFLHKRELVLNNCPRGVGYFCDGTPNRSAEAKGNFENIGVCEHLKSGECTYLKAVAAACKKSSRGRKKNECKALA